MKLLLIFFLLLLTSCFTQRNSANYLLTIKEESEKQQVYYLNSVSQAEKLIKDSTNLNFYPLNNYLGEDYFEFSNGAFHLYFQINK